MTDETRKVVILLGPPLSGKGTLAAKISNQFDLEHISTGDLFRQHIKEKTPLGTEANKYISQGKLVPDDLVIDMVFERMSKNSTTHGILLDGFPRTAGQAEAFQKRLTEKNALQVILLEADDNAIIERGSSRLTCTNPTCGRTYSITNIPPKTEGVCDICGSPVEVRADDKPDVIAQRLEVYHQQTSPLVEYYKNLGVLYSISATQTPEEVYQSAEEHLSK